MVITDRDIVIRCITDGNDPGTTTGGVVVRRPPGHHRCRRPGPGCAGHHGGYQVRRLPVLDGDRLVGIVSESDIAHHASDRDIADTVQAVTEK